MDATPTPEPSPPTPLELALQPNTNVVLFDGVCNVCNTFVHFVIDRDPEGYYKFAPLQSPLGSALLDKFDLPHDLNTVVLVETDADGNSIPYKKSTAILRVASRLTGPWPLLYGFILVPWFLRDPAYALFAKSRYSLFGKEDSCRRPTPELKAKFLDNAVTEC